ncbi:LOB domain-containing protein 2-like [Papaver somniferum]|uniref:LOB domain-containing protein 2-like n=1 Tax=Papaver somniferum TaxID=3469 RepID=UPI000E6F4C60|nr:LOB domain-containing protein 2-like [Papaver somniferum]
MDEKNDVIKANNNPRQACAACKHQRKKCSQNCILSPFFPPEKKEKFQAVHKLFGVSNISKLLKGLHTLDERKRAIDSLIWEAEARERDPIEGGFGAFKKINVELISLTNHVRISNQPGLPKIGTNTISSDSKALMSWENSANNGYAYGAYGNVSNVANNNYIPSNGRYNNINTNGYKEAERAFGYQGFSVLPHEQFHRQYFQSDQQNGVVNEKSDDSQSLVQEVMKDDPIL